MVDETKINEVEIENLELIANKMHIICIESSIDYIFISDNKGKIIIYDITTKMPLKYINTNIEYRIDCIKIIDNNEILFSQGNKIKTIKNIFDKTNNKIVLTGLDIIDILECKFSIDDFDFNLKNNKVENLFIIEVENDQLTIYNLPSKFIIKEKISNIIGLVFIKTSNNINTKIIKNSNDEVDKLLDNIIQNNVENISINSNTNCKNDNEFLIISTFEGKLFKYSLKLNKLIQEINIKKYLSKELKSKNVLSVNYLANPPYISIINYNYNLRLVAVGLLNGVILSFKENSLKNVSLLKCHNAGIIKIGMFSYNKSLHNYNYSLGKDNKICLIKDFKDLISLINLNNVYINQRNDIFDISSINKKYEENSISFILSDNSQLSLKLINIKL